MRCARCACMDHDMHGMYGAWRYVLKLVRYAARGRSRGRYISHPFSDSVELSPLPVHMDKLLLSIIIGRPIPCTCTCIILAIS